MRKVLQYNPKLKLLARQLRNQSTISEILLWEQVKNKQRGYDFHRQKPIGNFIVDFFCPDLMLAIEIDGESHDFKVGKDEARQKSLETLGIIFLRFDDRDVKESLEGILEIIDAKIKMLEGFVKQ